MTKALQQAVSAVAAILSPADQDRLARLMVHNLDHFRELLEDEADERAFEASAIEAIESEGVQSLLARAAAKHAS
jgi:predicted aminopeptidase